MPGSGTKSSHDLQETEVLTLAETAAFLRVPEQAVLDLINRKILPAQQIGSEWRLLKRAVVEWLYLGPQLYHEFRKFPPPWMLDHPFWIDLIQALESRLLSSIHPLEQPASERGTRKAVLKHFGVFQQDADLEEQLTEIRTRREAADG